MDIAVRRYFYEMRLHAPNYARGLKRWRWLFLAALPVLVLFSFRFVLASWLIDQFLIVTRSLCTPPATKAQWHDPNFWTGNLLGSALVISVTWWALTG